MSALAAHPPAGAAPSWSDLAEKAEWAACFGILLLMSAALLGPVFAPDQNPDAVPWLRTIWLPVYAAIGLMMVTRPHAMARVIAPAVMGLVLVAWAMASSRWSIAGDVTVRRSIALLMTTCFGLYLGARFGWKQLVEMFAATYFVLAIGSVIAALAFPTLGVHATIHPGAWRGLWYEKNTMGGHMVVGFLALAVAAIMAPERRKFWIAGAVLTAVLVKMSTSTTSLLGLLIAIGALIALAIFRRGGVLSVLLIWGAVVGTAAFLALILLAPDVFFHLIGKDPTLTGRTGIWEALFRRVAIHPWEGYGYGAFWIDPYGPSWFIRNEVQWAAPEAHNGWLDILAQLGFIGLALAACHYVVALIVAFAPLRKGLEAYWTIVFMVLFALFSVSESSVMKYNGISWVMYIATMAKLMAWRGFAIGEAPAAPRNRLFPDEEPAEMWTLSR